MSKAQRFSPQRCVPDCGFGYSLHGFCMVVIPAILESDAENHAQGIQ